MSKVKKTGIASKYIGTYLKHFKTFLSILKAYRKEGPASQISKKFVLLQ